MLSFISNAPSFFYYPSIFFPHRKSLKEKSIAHISSETTRSPLLRDILILWSAYINLLFNAKFDAIVTYPALFFEWDSRYICY